MADKASGKQPRKPRSGIIDSAGRVFLCLETYKTLKRRLLDESGFVEVTHETGFKTMLNKNSVQILQTALEKPVEEPKKKTK